MSRNAEARRAEDGKFRLIHAAQSSGPVPSETAAFELSVYELSESQAPHPRPAPRLDQSEGGTVLLEHGVGEALLIAGAAIRRMPASGSREDLLQRAAIGAAAWEREQARLLRRTRALDQMAELAAELNRVDAPAMVSRVITEAAVRIVGGYRAYLLLRDRDPATSPPTNPRFVDAEGGRLRALRSCRLSLPGVILAREAQPEFGMPFSDLAPAFEESSAAMLIHTPVGADGVLLIGERRQDRVVEQEDHFLLRNLALLAEGALLRVFSVEEANRLSLVDPLTGLANRRHMQLLMRHVWASARRGRPFAVILLDLDDFKLINDTVGHLAGDRILLEFAEILQDEVRGSDLVVRYGGDEFLIVLPEETTEGARALVERIQRRLQGKVGMSAGLAEYHPGLASIEEILELADRDLYAMKRAAKGPRD